MLARALLLLAASASALRFPTLASRVSSARTTTIRCDAISDAAALLGLGDSSEGPAPADQSKKLIEGLIAKNKVMLFMKGNKNFPQCGFSNTAVRILQEVVGNDGFETFDVLSDEGIREGIKQYSNWPTIPQCYINGEFIGGCDLMIEMFENGELKEMTQEA